MEYEDIVDVLFDKQEEGDLFCLDDDALCELDDQIELINNKINHYINKRVHPRSRKVLVNLINQKEKLMCSYNHRENRLLYRNGVSDGVSFAFNSLANKK